VSRRRGHVHPDRCRPSSWPLRAGAVPPADPGSNNAPCAPLPTPTGVPRAARV
jgi:hypothetical protein